MKEKVKLRIVLIKNNDGNSEHPYRYAIKELCCDDWLEIYGHKNLYTYEDALAVIANEYLSDDKYINDRVVISEFEISK